MGRVMNHPAWVMSHLNLYAGIAVKLALGEAFEDPAEHRYGQKSEPLGDLGAYETRERLVAECSSWLHALGGGARSGRRLHGR